MATSSIPSITSVTSETSTDRNYVSFIVKGQTETIPTFFTTDAFTTFTNNEHLDSTSDSTNNMTSEEIKKYLEYLQDREFQLYLPTIIFLAVVAVTGLIGNVLVLLVYGSKYHRSPTRIFIMAMAFFDLFANIFCIPGDIYHIFCLWNYTQSLLCSFYYYCKSFATISSAIILLVIAVSRYIKICWPFSRQVTTKDAKIITTCTVIFVGLVSVPSGVLFGTYSKQTPRPGIVGYDCFIKDKYINTIWPLVNFSVLMFLFASTCIPLVLLFCLIGVKACQHRKFRSVASAHASEEATRSVQSKTSTTDDNADESKNRLIGCFICGRKKYQVSDCNSSSQHSKLEKSLRKKKISVQDIREKGLEQNDENCVRMVRSPTIAKAKVNFSMVHELTVKLNRLKSEETASSDENQTDYRGIDPLSEKECGATTADENSIEKSDDKKHEQMATNSDETRSDFENSEPQRGLASRLQWIDITYSLNEDHDDQSRADTATQGTPTKKSSLSSKISRENSFLKKQKLFRDILMAPLSKRRVKKSDTPNEGENNEENENTKKNSIERDELPSKCRNNTTGNSQTPSTNSDKEEKINRNRDAAETDTNYKSCSAGTKNKNGVISKTTRMLIIIMAVFVISYLPYMVIVLLFYIRPTLMFSVGTASTTVYLLFLRSYFLNSAANAIVYSICDARFRRHVLSIFKCRETNS